jgi:hypothetical protein
MNRFSAVLLGLCFLFSGGALQAKPCGSDGPIPFLNMTGSITLPVKAIQSVGSVQEFTYWETQDALVYRNDSDQLRVSYFGSGVDTPLASLSFPLSKLVDPSERYLTTDERSYFYDASTSGPLIRYSKDKPAPQKLFWEGKDLYLMSWETPFLFDSPHFEVGRYTAGDKSAKGVCKFYPPSGAKLAVAEGHSYPNVFFYQTIPFQGKNMVALYQMNVQSCALTPVGFPTEPIAGDILAVHRFEKQNAFAVEIDHPTMNFRWDMGGRCEYLAIGPEEVMIPNHDRPLAVTWDPGKGLSLFNLETKKKADAFRTFGLNIKDVTARDLFIPEHESDLLMSPELEKVQARRMLTVDVEQILPVASH